jgi:putative hydrolase of the HAD superfamily
MTRAVFFDFYGTLARATAWGPTIEDVLTEFGAVLDPEARARWQAEVADGVDHLEHSADRDRYVAWEQARLRRLAASCGADNDEVVAALYRAVKTFTLLAYDEAPAVLAELRSRGLTLAVCSNWDWDLEGALEGCGLGGAVDVVVTSARAGARKPHPRIYAHTLDRCGGVAPGDVVFVGDTWEPDVVGPISAGMRAVHVWRDDDQREPPPPPNGAERIADLRGLLDLI